jgi:hypothetical protein
VTATDMIVEDEALLTVVADLLTTRRPLSAWPAEATNAFALALAAQPAAEGWKASTLRRHLFGSDATVPELAVNTAPTARERRRAERLRSDLIAILPLRAARYLAT